jgi:4-amino-4-deoxy-L-arabinose transferase-like glycosyltransferase
VTQELTRKRTFVSEEGRESAENASWHRLALVAILILSSFLNLFHLTNEGFGISYYAAAVKNMLSSWHNFFFVSFDSGFVSVDKPPLGLWIQAASAYLFGFSGLSLLLPQAIAGILCVAVLYHLLSRTFGVVAGLIGALVLAITPISVATSRNNTMDMLLVLSVLVAAWAFVQAARRGSLGWLVVGAILVGLGFNIKMLEAFLVLPALYLVYVLGSPVRLRRRLVHLGLATVVLVVVSLSWAVVVDLTPAGERPYVGSTSDNTVTNLILGYNGLDRLLGTSFRAEEAMAAGELGGPGLGTKQNGEPGPLRLLNHQYAGQIGWLLPLAVVGGLAASRQSGFRLPLDRRQGALVLWGTWFLTAAVYFSVAGGGHPYYTVMLAPAAAALVGVGVVALWSDYKSPDGSGWLLPLVLVGMAILQAYILGGYEGWSLMLTPLIVLLCFIAAAVLVVLRLSLNPKLGAAYAAAATAVGILALLVAPTVWASYQVFQGSGGSLPVAGPPPLQAFAGMFGGFNTQGGLGQGNTPGSGRIPFRVGNPVSIPPGGGSPGGKGPGSALKSDVDPALIDYLLAHQGKAKYLVAATRSSNTAPLILSTDKPVISLGGYNGVDPVFTTNELADLVNEDAVRFFLIPDSEPMTQMMPGVFPQQPGWQGAPPSVPLGVSRSGLGSSPDPPQNRSTRWVQDNCQRVPQELWQSPTLGQGGGFSMNGQALYDCGAGRR